MALQINHISIIVGQQEAPALPRHGSTGNPGEGTATNLTSNGPWTPSWSGPKMSAAKSFRPSQTCTTPTSAKSWVSQSPQINHDQQSWPSALAFPFSFSFWDDAMLYTNKLNWCLGNYSRVLQKLLKMSLLVLDHTNPVVFFNTAV